MRVSGTVVIGALKGAVLAVIVAALLGIIVTFPYYGFGSLLMPLYFGAYLVIYAAPIGAFLGVLWTAFRMSRMPKDSEGNKLKKNSPHARVSYLVGIGIPLIITCGILSFVYVIGNPSHDAIFQATWRLKSYPDCETSVVHLILKKQSRSDYVCSEALLEHLQSIGEPTVIVTYRVAQTLGQYSSYTLTFVDSVSVTGEQWVSGSFDDECGTEHFYRCGSAEIEYSPVFDGAQTRSW